MCWGMSCRMGSDRRRACWNSNVLCSNLYHQMAAERTDNDVSSRYTKGIRLSRMQNVYNVRSQGHSQCQIPSLSCCGMHRCPSWMNKQDLHVCWLRATTHLSTVVSFCVMLSDIKSSLFSIVPLECIHIATDIFNCRDENRFDSYVECRTRELPSWGNTPNTESLAVFFEIVLLMGHYCLSSRKYWRSLFHLLLSVLVFRLYLCATTEQVSSQQMILKAC